MDPNNEPHMGGVTLCGQISQRITATVGRLIYPLNIGSNPRRMWQGLQTITDYKGKPSHELLSATNLPGALSDVYSRYEASITLSVADVSKTFNLFKLGGRIFTF